MQSMGCIFKSKKLGAAQEDIDIAIKAIQISKIANCKQEVLSEIALLCQIHHPCLARYYEVYQDERHLFLVMEYVDGTPLDRALVWQPSNKYSEQLTRIFMRQLFEGIKEAHTKGVVHRGIEPKNIIIKN
jgi:calcium-dependent protein kinase